MKEIISMLLPLLGGVVGWCGSELTRKWSNRYLKVQVLNNALSWMLDLYFQVNAIKSLRGFINEFIKWYNALLAENSMTEHDMQAVNVEVKNKILPLVMSIVEEDVTSMGISYEKAVGELSMYYPVVAYRLRGRADIKMVIADIKIYCKKVEEQQNIQIGEYIDMFGALQDIVQTTITETNILALRNEIIELSKETNRKHRKEILKALNNIDQPGTLSVQYKELIKEQITAIFQ